MLKVLLSQNKNMKADIFIPTSNRIDALSQCVASLDNQTRKDFKVYLVGISKDEEVKKIIKKYNNLDIEYFIQNKKGIIGAGNEALKKSRNEIFVRIDDDVVLDSHWYENLLETYAKDEKIGGVTGPTIMSAKGIKSRDLTAFLSKFKKSRNPIFKFFAYIYNDFLYEGKIYEVSRFLESGVFTLGSNFEDCLKPKNSFEIDSLEACNWSSRTLLLKEVGGFDEIFLKGLGDYHESDAAFKIKRLGYKLVFNPKVNLRHNVEIGKVEKARPAPYYRIQNFIIFYFRFFKIKKVSQFFKFSTNLGLQNGYYLFRFFTTFKLNQLGSIPGTFVGLIKIFFLPKNKKI
jgi:glycosyltransferase involved in cell wall biosynthesis